MFPFFLFSINELIINVCLTKKVMSLKEYYILLICDFYVHFLCVFALGICIQFRFIIGIRIQIRKAKVKWIQLDPDSQHCFKLRLYNTLLRNLH